MKTRRRGILRRGSSRYKRPEVETNLIHWRDKINSDSKNMVWPEKVDKGQRARDKVSSVGHTETVSFCCKEKLKATLKWDSFREAVEKIQGKPDSLLPASL